MLGTLIDRLLSAIAPERAVRRVAARRLLGELSRGYDAGRQGRFQNDWRVSNRSADLEMLGDADVVRARARDLVRNNAHAQGVIRSLLRNVVGCGIKPQSRLRFADGRERDGMNEAIESFWDRWQSTADVTGRLSFYEMQRLCYSETKEAGECLVRFVNSRDRSRPVPLALEMIEADRLASDEFFFRGVNRANGNEVRRGVEIDGTGIPIAYHLYRRNQNDIHAFDTIPERIPAEQVLHLFQQKRIGQTRGITDFAPIVQWIRDLDQYMTTEMKSALIASCFSVAIKTEAAGADGAIAGLTQDDTAEDDGAVFEQLKAGLVARLFPGEDISVINPSRGSTEAAVWVNLMQRAMAVGSGLSYERLTRDYSGTTFSSNRASDLEDRKDFRSEQDWLVAHLCTPVWRRFVMAAADAGITGFPTPLQLMTQFDAFTAHEWQSPGWEWVDPRNEATAAHQALEDGTTTLRDELSKKGLRDWRDVMRQRAIEQAFQQELNDEFGLTSNVEITTGETEPVEADEDDDGDEAVVSSSRAGHLWN